MASRATGNNGWLVTVKSDGDPDYKFRLPRVSREEAIAQAGSYAKIKLGPQFKNLTDSELRMAERMAVTNRLDAFVFYVQSRLPDDLAEKFLELGASVTSLSLRVIRLVNRLVKGLMLLFGLCEPLT